MVVGQLVVLAIRRFAEFDGGADLGALVLVHREFPHLGDGLGHREEVGVGESEADEQQVAGEHQRLDQAAQRSVLGLQACVLIRGENDGVRCLDVAVQFQQPRVPASWRARTWSGGSTWITADAFSRHGS